MEVTPLGVVGRGRKEPASKLPLLKCRVGVPPSGGLRKRRPPEGGTPTRQLDRGNPLDKIRRRSAYSAAARRPFLIAPVPGLPEECLPVHRLASGAAF